ncbi:MAG: nuclease domain-containing protein [Coleofasciculus sp. G1-WW12-02]|uniref:nuclease domain-containing protein n=1 Tax=Coleofasciculus sp. G1-WW12-02 TaxID=3068483 RepID=UPI0032F74CE2
MNYPILYFIDSKGRELEKNEDGIQYIKQYNERWRVRIQGESQGRVVLDGSPGYPLDKINGSSNDNDWELPDNISFEDRKKVTGAGYITAKLLDQTDKILCQGTLLVFPSNVTEKELEQMIKEIGQLALATASCVYRNLEGGQGEGYGIEGVGLKWHPSQGLLTTATSLLELAEVVKNNWNVLEKRPLKTFVAKAELVNRHKIKLSPQSLIRAKVEPAKQKILAFAHVESTQCPENEFICYVLDVYLKDLANGIADSLDSLDLENIDESLIFQVHPRQRKEENEFSQFKQQSTRLARRRNGEREKLRRCIQKRILQLRDCSVWATKARNSEFIKTVNTPNEPPPASWRLRGSPTYGSIFTKFYNCKGNVSQLQPIERVLYLFKCIYEGRVRTTWEIYELWCFVRLYSAFILYVNMKPPRDKDFVFEKLNSTSEGLKLPDNSIFQLQGHIDKANEITVSFWYNNWFKGKKPDIRIEISIGNELKQYCFDAKYKNYQQQGHNTFVEDVLGVARDKYLNYLNSDASFILHTDESIDYWGEVPFNQILQKHFNIEINSLVNISGKDANNYNSYPLITKNEHFSDGSGYSGHKYGAISLRPKQDTERQLKKLIRLLLQYHGSLKTVCIACSHQLKYEVEVRTSWIAKKYSETELIDDSLACNPRLKTILYCSCKQCGDFWVVSHCQGNRHHRLLKFKDSFHKKSDLNSDKWLYDCPVCGDKL